MNKWNSEYHYIKQRTIYTNEKEYHRKWFRFQDDNSKFYMSLLYSGELLYVSLKFGYLDKHISVFYNAENCHIPDFFIVRKCVTNYLARKMYENKYLDCL